MPEAMRNPGDPADDLYVGYLPVPDRHRRFLRVVVPAMLWALAGAAFVIARAQQEPGTGVWEDARARTLTGLVVARPYPMLLADDRGDGRAGLVLLVEVGKHGGGARALGLDGKRASISGWPLHRDGRFMLEMEPGESAINAESKTAATALIATRPLGRVTLKGEIVDSKCFLGAMKPGDGKTHKECATLCIAGGIPPMLVTRDAKGTATYYLLTDPDGGSLGGGALPLVADPVEVTGELEERGGILLLRVSVDDIHRL